MQFPSREVFLSQADERRPMPVFRDVLADFETPLSVYWKLSHDETYSFLLESVTGGEQLARYSIIGSRPRAVLRTKGNQVRRLTRSGERKFEIPVGLDPLTLLNEEIGDVEPIEVEGMPKFVGGVVGILGYDLVRFFEKLPEITADDLEVDDLAMMVPEGVVVFDHARNLIRIIVLALGTAEGYEEASAEIERIAAKLRRPIPELPKGRSPSCPVVSSFERPEFEQAVAKCQSLIGDGDGVQFVISQRFATKTDAHPMSVYRALRSLNPSPYMFLFRFGDLDVVGASPELLVSSHQGIARVRPIAGTRWRGKSVEEDDALAAELLADEKERSEHIMLVDLGRNDLGRVCEFGSVTVRDLMVVERYSHVMHIVSDVAGRLAVDRSPLDLLRATFPAGTVTGAPKVRAMEVIESLEPNRRGIYAGSVGYIGANGDLDMAIAIRTIVLKSGTAYVQAGAGIVWDSVPSNEFEECANKARAALTAIEIANSGLPDSL